MVEANEEAIAFLKKRRELRWHQMGEDGALWSYSPVKPEEVESEVRRVVDEEKRAARVNLEIMHMDPRRFADIIRKIKKENGEIRQSFQNIYAKHLKRVAKNREAARKLAEELKTAVPETKPDVNDGDVIKHLPISRHELAQGSVWIGRGQLKAVNAKPMKKRSDRTHLFIIMNGKVVSLIKY
jgi:hypothetical protein